MKTVIAFKFNHLFLKIDFPIESPIKLDLKNKKRTKINICSYL